MSSLSSILLALTLLLFVNTICIAQDSSQSTPLPRSATLPRTFSRFSANDVLGRVFDGYDSATGRVASILNEQQRPALVRINEARLWRVEGQEYLIVLIELAADDYQVSREGGLCGACATYALLAVLKQENNNLQLVAKQTAPASSVVSNGPPDADPLFDRYGPEMYTGHSSLSLDLAPYRLNTQETMVGVRQEHIWTPAEVYSTSLRLYRIEGERLRAVFEDLVIDREYPGEQMREGRTVLKTVSTLMTVPSRGEYYDLVINKVTFRCSDRNGDDDCSSQDGVVQRVRNQREIWRFDGERFNLQRGTQ
jgi:hypothetical protein